MHCFYRVMLGLTAGLAFLVGTVGGECAADGLVGVGTQPNGGLANKTVYIHGGHGYTADNLDDGAWSFQRPNLLGMVEDLGNVDQMTYLADE